MQFMPEQLSFRLVNQFGMVPIRYSDPDWAQAYGLPEDYGLSFLTNLFLHGGWWHLVINMWFMWIFADNIEDRMGHIGFLIFFLICGIFATLLQWYFDPSLAIPVVGASGSIAGVLAAYFFLYPLARVIIWVPVLFYPLLFPVPAIAFLGGWVILQLHDAVTSILFKDVGIGVAWWAHLGGFISGGLLYRLFLLKSWANKS
jgi:membrane associated rhomboid family serine protease